MSTTDPPKDDEPIRRLDALLKRMRKGSVQRRIYPPAQTKKSQRLQKLREELDQLTDALLADVEPPTRRETFQEALRRIAAEEDDAP